MAYNPGITNRSGEILAQGIASAAQTRMQGYQNVVNSLLKGFSDLTKKQQEDELQIRDANSRLSSDPELERKIRASGNTKLIASLDKLQTPETGMMNKFFGSGKGSDAKDIIEYGKGVDTAKAKDASEEARRFRVAEETRKVAEETRKQDAAAIVAKEYANLETWRTDQNAAYNTGAKRLSEYNDLKNFDEKNERKIEQVNLRNQFISGTPTMAKDYKKSAPPALGQFDQIGDNSSRDPRVGFTTYPKLGTGPKVTESQTARLYGTPEEVNQMVYAYTPGSNSVQQRIRNYGNTITPELMRGENTIEAARDRVTYQADVAKANAMNTEQRNRQLDANAAEQLSFSRRADERAARGEERLIANEARPTLLDLITRDLGANRQRETEQMFKELSANPRVVQFIKVLDANFGIVPQQHKAAVEKILSDPSLTQAARDFLRNQIRK